LFLDDVVIAHLLAFFNPTLRSLRTIEDFSQTRQAQRHLSVRRLCKSTLSDFHRVADPALLAPIVERLKAVAASRGLPATPASLPATLGQVLAVDGSFFAVAADVAWAVRHRTNQGQTRACVRLDMHLDVATWLPQVVAVSGSEMSEAEHAATAITPGAIHVYDRGIFSFDLLEQQHKAQAFFVHRLREPGPRCPKFSGETPRPLTPEDEAAGVLSDTLGRMAGSQHRPAPDLALREVIVRSPDEPGGVIRLLTNLLEVEAWAIALLYRYRWHVELFFRWLKCFANFAHLMSESRQGVLLSFYVAVIGVLLMYLHTGAKPSKYAFSLLGLVASGASTLEEIGPILAERERRIALENARRMRRKQNMA
jgi:transposase